MGIRDTLLLATILVLMAGCNKANNKEGPPAYQDLYTLAAKGQFRLNADYVGSFWDAQYLYTDDVAGKEYLVAIMPETNSLVWFDLELGEAVEFVDYPQEGPKGIPDIENFCIVNRDSIFISSRGIVHLVNQVGDILGKWSVFQLLEQPTNIRHFGTIYPMKFIKGKLYMSSYAGGNVQQKRPVMLVLDVNHNTMERKIDFPAAYYAQEGIWGSGAMGAPRFDFNADRGEFIISFPASHKLQVAGLSLDEVTEHWARSRHFPEVIPITFTSEERNNGTTQDPNTYSYRHLLRHRYDGVHYDPYRKLYYRFAFQPSSEANYNSEDHATKFIRARSLIILNDAFEQVGEVSLDPAVHSALYTIIREDGIYIRKHPAAPEDEDYITYEIFEPVPVAP